MIEKVFNLINREEKRFFKKYEQISGICEAKQSNSPITRIQKVKKNEYSDEKYLEKYLLKFSQVWRKTYTYRLKKLNELQKR